MPLTRCFFLPPIGKRGDHFAGFIELIGGIQRLQARAGLDDVNIGTDLQFLDDFELVLTYPGVDGLAIPGWVKINNDISR